MKCFVISATLAVTALLALLGLPAQLQAAPTLREQRTVEGDVLVLGSTLAHDCGSGKSPPTGTTVSCTGLLDQDSAPDVYWRDDRANAGVVAADARTSAALALPDGAEVVYARLYWGAMRASEAPDRAITLDREGAFSATVNADDSRALPAAGPLPDINYVTYQSTADVTALVKQHGSGAYRVSGVDGIVLNGVLSENAFSAWTLVVVYQRATAAVRRIHLYDGLDPISPGMPVSFTVSLGTAAAHANVQLSLWAYDGDARQAGDVVTVQGVPLTSGDNPADNLFNGSRTAQGVPKTGLVPPLAGEADTMSGFDLDTFDVSAAVGTSPMVQLAAATNNDAYWLAGFVLSVAAPPVDGGAGGDAAGAGGTGGSSGLGGAGDGGGLAGGGSAGGTVDGGNAGNTDSAGNAGGTAGGANTVDGGGSGGTLGGVGDGGLDAGGAGRGSDADAVQDDGGAVRTGASAVAEGSGLRCNIGPSAPEGSALPSLALIAAAWLTSRRRRRLSADVT